MRERKRERELFKGDFVKRGIREGDKEGEGEFGYYGDGY